MEILRNLARRKLRSYRGDAREPQENPGQDTRSSSSGPPCSTRVVPDVCRRTCAVLSSSWAGRVHEGGYDVAGASG